MVNFQLNSNFNRGKINKLRIFISFSKRDQDVAKEIQKFFEDYGFECFLSVNSIKSGDDWRESILDEIQKSKIFIFILSENFKDSDWCDQEAGMAILKKAQGFEILIFPLRLSDEIKPYGFLNKYQGVNYDERTLNLILNQIEKFFEDYVIVDTVNDNGSLIELPKTFYFNIDDLIEKRKIEASVELSDKDPKRIIKIEHIPNNIDTFDKEKGGYIFKYSSGKEGHKGIIPYYLDDGTVSEFNIVYLIFEYINPQIDAEANLKITVTDLQNIKVVEGITPSEHKNLLLNLKTVTDHLAKFVQLEKENQKEEYNANFRIVGILRSRLIKYFNIDPSFLEYYYKDKQRTYNIEEEHLFLEELKELLNKEDFESIKKKIIYLRKNRELYRAIVYNALGGERVTEICIELDTNEFSEDFINTFVKEINMMYVDKAINNLEERLLKIKNRGVKRYNFNQHWKKKK